MSTEIISRRHKSEADELLLCHAKDVGERLPMLSSFDHDGNPSMFSIAQCTGYLHDLGKATTYFQRYIRGKYIEETRLRYHARLGAFATFYTLGEMGASDELKLAGFLAVLKHHGRLPDAAEKALKDTLTERDRKSREGYIRAQIENIESTERNRTVADQLLQTASNGEATWSSFYAAVSDESLFDQITHLVGKKDLYTFAPNTEKLSHNLYDVTIQLWSALTFADKTSAGGVNASNLLPSHLGLYRLESHIARLQIGLDEPPELTGSEETLSIDVSDTDALNQTRESIRRVVRSNAKRFAEGSQSVATLTLPTGLGKTFAGLTAAYTIRDSYEHNELDEVTKPRVIYALPYTSIIEQTRDIFEDSRILDADPRGQSFTVHHYLSETVTYPEADEQNAHNPADDSEFSDATLLGESWRSGTVLTTFVQLFESLAAPSNSQGLKLSAITDSVIILDEPQTLPKPWWNAIRRLTKLLIEQYNVQIISMTATQPSLFTHSSEIETISLLSDSDAATSPLETACFEAVTRVKYNIDESAQAFGPNAPLVSAEDAGNRLFETAIKSTSNGTSVLSVCNTIRSTTATADAVSKAAARAGITVTRIGSEYRSALTHCTPTPTTDGTVESTNLPSPETVAAATLEQLGLEPVNPTEETPLAEQRWKPTATVDLSEIFLGTFTSRIRPRDRRSLVIIANILARAKVPFVFVSTQAIEAGVDISFAKVYRDIAPLDSIVQAAGRCNRSFEWGEGNGDVTIWALAPTKDTSDPPSTYVYQPRSQLTEVAQILSECCTSYGSSVVPESMLTREAVPSYFDWVDSADLSNPKILDHINACRADQLNRYHLIDDEYEKFDVVVAETALEKELVSQMTEAFGIGNKPLGFSLLSALSDLRVSVPVKDIEEVHNRVYRVDHRELTDTNGVQVLVCVDAGDGKLYDLGSGGFILDEDDGLAGRFTF
ncbi:CRISPR-associated endonuclease Cas3'' [Natronocalculus amylovorans]|uniref:CRISPR-associated endonuclease Cas3 n=1 Tax=Natronocalculus amylovorans TaxID=2917812 RepID=A0AAE3FZS9_9EURY|nr:CRISPR-associated endonuclease Cas3'' [Natronocalculus amylovorans]MCL9818356.1 CRISPR-associated endonuclease Cas3'' [Natronocalculus amylovorans]